MHIFLDALVVFIGSLVLSTRGLAVRDGERCTSDNFGVSPEEGSSTWDRPFLDMDTKSLVCSKKVHSQLKDTPLFALNYYRSYEAFNKFDGVDLNPARHYEYSPAFKKSGAIRAPVWTGWEKISNLSASNKPPFWNESADLSTCEIKQPDGYFYRIQEVGPITSTGGYDFWQFGWKDAFGLSEVLKEHPDGIMFDAAFSAAVLPDGTPLGLPPIHIHHIHMGPHTGVKAKEESHARVAIEQHGDYECKEIDGGTRCLFEKVPEGYGKVLRQTVDLEGELNDVRAPNSPPLTWYYKIIIRYRPYSPKSSVIPVSQAFMIGPSDPCDFEKGNCRQLDTLLAFQVPSAEDTIYWYTKLMPHSGKMVRNKLHSHNLGYNRSFFFHATPQQLGLDTDNLRLGYEVNDYFKRSPNTITLKDSGFKDFQSLEAYLFQNLKAAQNDTTQVRPSLVCESWGAREEQWDPATGKNYLYDRRAPVCCKPWQFEKHDVVTVVGFINKITRPLGPHAPNTIPPKTDMHIHWVMSATEYSNASIYRIQVGSMLSEDSNQYVASNLSIPIATDWGFTGMNNEGKGSGQMTMVAGFLQTSSATSSLAVDKRATYAQVFGAIMVFILGAYIAHKCSSESQPLTKPAVVCARCCPPLPPQVKTRYPQYHTV